MDKVNKKESSDWKEDFYKSYVSSHTSRRKKKQDQHEMSICRRIFEYQIGPFIPVDADIPIIDVGCGNGNIVDWLHKRGCLSAYGVDVSQEQIAQGKELGINQLISTEILSFFKNDTRIWERMIFRNVLEHFSRPLQIELLRLCARNLSPEGKFIIQVPNGESPFFGRIRYGDYTHEVAFTASSISQLLTVIGFNKINVFPCSPVYTSVKSFFRISIWRIIEKILKFIIFAETGSKSSIVTRDIIAVAEGYINN